MMLIGDGVLPSNEARGYVLRRMMRRTIRNMRILGAPDRNTEELIKASIGAMGPQYPELVTDRNRILAVANAEEESFLSTLKSGTQIFDVAVGDVKKSTSSKLTGDTVFKLHDTYGFPFDLTLEMATEQGLTVDEDGFRKLMKEQKDRAKADAKAKKSGHADVSEYRSIVDAVGTTQFLGYSQTQSEGIL
jgi:alanyl-tRNA synthetase